MANTVEILSGSLSTLYLLQNQARNYWRKSKLTVIKNEADRRQVPMFRDCGFFTRPMGLVVDLVKTSKENVRGILADE